jgi:pre-60S factor REI1
MSTSHGLFIPPFSHVSDTPSLLAYLAILVYEFHECVYCGKAKGSVESVQTHMRDKGHCKIAEGEMEDFRNEEESEKTRIMGEEMRLESGKLVTKKPHTARLRNTRRHSNNDGTRTVTLLEHPHAPPQNTRESRIALRNDLGLLGLSNHQRRAVVASEMKMQTRRVVAEKKGKYKMLQAPVLTKYYKVRCFF